MHKSKYIITNRRIRIGVVGCGRISSNHFKAIELHRDHLQLAAICDIDPNVLRSAQAEYGVNGYGSLTELLAMSDVDLVVLCTPSGLHSAQAIEVAAAGRHVMT